MLDNFGSFDLIVQIQFLLVHVLYIRLFQFGCMIKFYINQLKLQLIQNIQGLSQIIGKHRFIPNFLEVVYVVWNRDIGQEIKYIYIIIFFLTATCMPNILKVSHLLKLREKLKSKTLIIRIAWSQIFRSYMCGKY